MEQTKWSMGTIVALIVGLIIGFLIGWGVYGRSAATPTGNDLSDLGEEGTVTTTETPLDANGDSVIDLSQVTSNGQFSANNQGAGTAVTVLNVTTNGSTWVAVREYQGGKLGNVLGARRIDVPSQAGVEVPLLRSTVAGQTYAVVLYRDDGDKLFDHKVDQLVEMGGQPVLATFKAL